MDSADNSPSAPSGSTVGDAEFSTEYSDLTVASYLERTGIDGERIESRDTETLTRVQQAHIRTIPFENLAIAPDPAGRLTQSGVTISLPDLYEKIVERHRGGYCFELNGLFTWLLRELGYDASRVAARVLSDGDPGIPANHHSIIVEFDRPYVVDVGLGTPKLPRPVPLDGSIVSGPVGDWRIVTADRPDEDYRLEFREDDNWSGRYVFTDTPRDLAYFRAANDYLQTAPESPFTGTTHVSIATDQGYISLNGQDFVRVENETRTENTLDDADWYDHLSRTFGIDSEA
jgi:N-hydroxyarylamine O-acetyltransferase